MACYYPTYQCSIEGIDKFIQGKNITIQKQADLDDSFVLREHIICCDSNDDQIVLDNVEKISSINKLFDEAINFDGPAEFNPLKLFSANARMLREKLGLKNNQKLIVNKIIWNKYDETTPNGKIICEICDDSDPPFLLQQFYDVMCSQEVAGPGVDEPIPFPPVPVDPSDPPTPGPDDLPQAKKFISLTGDVKYTDPCDGSQQIFSIKTVADVNSAFLTEDAETFKQHLANSFQNNPQVSYTNKKGETKQISLKDALINLLQSDKLLTINAIKELKDNILNSQIGKKKSYTFPGNTLIKVDGTEDDKIPFNPLDDSVLIYGLPQGSVNAEIKLTNQIFPPPGLQHPIPSDPLDYINPKTIKNPGKDSFMFDATRYERFVIKAIPHFSRQSGMSLIRGDKQGNTYCELNFDAFTSYLNIYIDFDVETNVTISKDAVIKYKLELVPDTNDAPFTDAEERKRIEERNKGCLETFNKLPENNKKRSFKYLDNDITINMGSSRLTISVAMPFYYCPESQKLIIDPTKAFASHTNFPGSMDIPLEEQDPLNVLSKQIFSTRHPKEKRKFENKEAFGRAFLQAMLKSLQGTGLFIQPNYYYLLVGYGRVDPVTIGDAQDVPQIVNAVNNAILETDSSSFVPNAKVKYQNAVDAGAVYRLVIKTEDNSYNMYEATYDNLCDISQFEIKKREKIIKDKDTDKSNNIILPQNIIDNIKKQLEKKIELKNADGTPMLDPCCCVKIVLDDTELLDEHVSFSYNINSMKVYTK
jgi:hypothetical protein